MDLISIARKYKNIRRIILLSFIVITFVYAILAVSHVYANKRNEETIIEYIKIAEILKQEVELNRIEEQKNKAPILTQEGMEAFKSIYKTETKQVFLTFDDGPSKKVTIPILDLLREKNIKATFFVLGSRVELYPEIVKRAYDEGHYIANHGYSHKYSQIYHSASSVLDEYNKTNEAVKNAIKNQQYNTNIFRFPGGSVGSKYQQIKADAKELLRENNIATVDWNALTGDTEGLKKEEELFNRLKETCQNKTSVVILMHDSGDKSYTYTALPQIIEYLKQEGYEFKNFYDVIK